MIPSRRVGPSALFVLSLALLSSCASGPQFYANAPPIDMSPAAIMAAKTCSPLPVDTGGSVNVVQGWEKLKGADCGGKYASGVFRCADPSKCGPLVYTVLFGEKDRDTDKRFDVDGIGGAFESCAEPAFRFGFGHGIDCKRISFSGDSVRAVLTAKVPPLAPGSSEQTTPLMQVTVWPKGDKPVTIGQIGFIDIPAQ